MSHANDSHVKYQRDDLSRQLADRLGRLVAREYLSRQNIDITNPSTASNPSRPKQSGNDDRNDRAIIPRRLNDAESGK